MSSYFLKRFGHFKPALAGIVFASCLSVFTSSRADIVWQSEDPDTSFLHMPEKMFNDLPYLFIPENLIPVAAGSVVAAVDWSTFDRQDTLASSLDNLNLEPVFDFGTFYGEGWVEGFGAAGSWGVGALTNDLRMQEFGRDASESLIMAAVMVTGLKYAVDRTRPNGLAYSFPSGHTITAFCVAPVIQKYWGWEAGIPAYALAAVTGFARVEDYWHYLSDVAAGAALGIVIGNSVVYSPKDVAFSAFPGGLEAKWSFD